MATDTVTLTLTASDGATTTKTISVPYLGPVSTGQPLSTAANFPASTGVPAGTALHVVAANEVGQGWHADANRNVIIDQAGITLDSLDIYGVIVDWNHAFTVKRSRIRGVGEGYWLLSLHGGVTYSQCEIGGGADGVTQLPCIAWRGDNGASSVQNVIDRCNIHHCVHGGRLDGGTKVSNSWIHDIPISPKGAQLGAHTDGIMCTGYANKAPIQILNNRISGGNTAVIFVQWETGNTLYGATPFVVDGNYLQAALDPDAGTPGHVPPWNSSWACSFESKGLDSSGSKFIQITNNTVDPLAITPTSGGYFGHFQAPAGRWTASGNKTISGVAVTVSNS